MVKANNNCAELIRVIYTIGLTSDQQPDYIYELGHALRSLQGVEAKYTTPP
jgi:hypothetical protein